MPNRMPTKRKQPSYISKELISAASIAASGRMTFKYIFAIKLTIIG